MKVTAKHFLGFQYSASEILKYISVAKDFTLMLSSGEFIKFTPIDDSLFEDWLIANKVQNIRKEEGWITE
ncbi:hypothetical protein LAG90_02775 [Marinilongibacter aquaticus]|uniref:hypothetical protein n=1 Tax=Marinilongibacter aquaticus TaxID=2975157 RepID=UPI0021BD27BD|nr:hypothetical protein [Marinilongibacter aquaticus]UBM59578.1 hypothetical protein LAG90_02775 [Marinilongibacter aquaticus]